MKPRHEIAEIVILFLCIVMLALSGCATAPPWERSKPECLQYANAACIAAMLNNHESGVVICTLPGTSDRHAVTWIVDDGKTLFWDAAWGFYRTQAELGTVHYMTDGISAGAFDFLPMPNRTE